MGAINKDWHLQNKMPKNPSEEERLRWHVEHAKHCSCHPMPESLKQKIEELKDKGDIAK